MFVAYLVPKHDAHLVVEDGLGYLTIGATKEEAEMAIRNLFEKEQVEQNQRAIAAGYNAEPLYDFEEDYVLHFNEV